MPKKRKGFIDFVSIKEKKSIEFIQKHEPKEGFMGCFSGGKDSVVLKYLAKKAKVNISWYYTLTPDPPNLVKFIKKNHSDVIFLRPDVSFYWLIKKWFPPNFFARWCCREIKEKPSWGIPLKHRLYGIRAEESYKRAKRGWVEKRQKGIIGYHPIFDWNEYDVWDYIERENLPYCSLYDEGFDRLGCTVCPMRGYKLHMKWKERFPLHFKMFENACYEWWERKGHHRESVRGYSRLFEEYMDNWYRRK